MNWKRRRKTMCCFGILLLVMICIGCGAFGQRDTGKMDGEMTEQEETGTKQSADTGNETDTGLSEDSEQGTGSFGESAADGHVDFDMLREKNPDIFAWLYIPGTDIDMPVLQSHISDDYYKTRDAMNNTDSAGALYTEMPNLMNMCDFNTIIHGNDLEEEGPFKELHLFEDADFFREHEEFYLYLPDNALAYEIFVAYYDEGSDILRRYDYTAYEGCQEYLEEIYSVRSMNRNFRDGWEGLTPYHFLVTLDGSIREDGTQYVVIGALKEDAAGTIDRVIYE